MLEKLVEIDTFLFRAINNAHCTALDWIMWTLSQHWCWAAVLLMLFLFLVLRTDKKRWWLVVIAVALCFLLADQGSVHLFKNTVCRLRPCYALEDVHMFHTRCGHPYCFISSHAANAFAVLVYLSFRYRSVLRWGKWTTLAWALLICYSRVYLGKHYPGDIIGGIAFGTLIGWVVWKIDCLLEKKWLAPVTK